MQPEMLELRWGKANDLKPEIDPDQMQYFLDQIKWAAENGLLCNRAHTGLIDQLYLRAHWGDQARRDRGEIVRSRICQDCAPHSFQFLQETGRMFPDGTLDWNLDYNGGLIYGGPDHPLDGSGPALTVSVSSSNQPGWSSHT